MSRNTLLTNLGDTQLHPKLVRVTVSGAKSMTVNMSGDPSAPQFPLNSKSQLLRLGNQVFLIVFFEKSLR